MKKGFERCITIAIIVFFLFSVMLPQAALAASKVKISNKEATILVSKSIQLSISGTKSTVKWSSSNSKVAKVNSKGKVTGIKPGKAVITAKVKKKKYTCNITVKIGLNKTKLSMYVGKKKTIKLCGTTIKKVKTSNKAVAKISKKGVVTAVGKGKATLTVTGKNNKNYKCYVTVKKKPTTYYQVVFDSDGGSYVEPQKVASGKTVSEPGIPYKEGYSFYYWALDGIEYDFSTPVKGNITLTAVWILNAPDNLDDDVVDLGDLEYLSDKEEIDVSYGTDGGVEFIDGQFTDTPVFSESDAIDLLSNNVNFLGGFYADDSEVTVNSYDSESETENYYRFSPNVYGVPVIGSQVILSTDADEGTVTGLSSSYRKDIYDVDTDAAIGEEEAVEKALDEIMSKNEVVSYLQKCIEDAEDTTLDYDTVAEEFRKHTQAETRLVIYAADEKRPPRLVYEVNINGPVFETNELDTDLEALETEETIDEEIDTLNVPIIASTIYITADNDLPEVYLEIDYNEGWMDVSVVGSSISDADVDDRINVQVDEKRLRLVDTPRNIKIYKSNWFYTNFNELGIYKGDLVSTNDYKSFDVDGAAVYCMYNMEKVYDYYKTVLKRRSFDGKGKAIIITYDCAKNIIDTEYNNACWRPYPYSQFEIGNVGGLFKCLDVIGHEFTHAVINYVVGDGKNKTLTYSGESGALNEAYADIMGSLIEGKNGEGRWLGAEDSDRVRKNMSDPTAFNDPTHYSQFSTNYKDGGVHCNSAIFSFAAYKMMTDIRNSNVSYDTWAKIYYKSLFALPTDATFLQARRSVLSAANCFGFSKEQLQAICDAYDDVGIQEPDGIRIVLNWGAIPEDLDAHLVGPTSDGEDSFHVYYNNLKYWDDNLNANVAALDYDDTTAYGPEIIRIYKLLQGDYYYYIHDYTNRYSSNSQKMAASEAYVRVFNCKTKKVIYATNIDTSSEGTVWDVLKVTISGEGVKVTPINTYRYVEEPEYIFQ